MKMEKLYFGVKVYDPNTNKLKTINLFGSQRIRQSVAILVKALNEPKPTANDRFIKKNVRTPDDMLSFCFADTRGRVEYEMNVSEPFHSFPLTKVDVWTMYVEPNKDILLDMVGGVSLGSAKKWLSDHRRAKIK